MNSINTWKQGAFIDMRQYDKMTPEWKINRRREELHLVRPTSTGNAICSCPDPEDAKWIASRLNVASDLEQLTSDYVTGKSGSEKLLKYMKDKLT